MDRREFLKTAAIAGIVFSIPASLDILTDTCEAAAKSDLIIVTGSNPATITLAAIDALGGMKKFISKGDIVVIKPNIGWDRLPEQAANTNPEVVATLVRMCLESGAKKVKVFDRPVNEPHRCYIQSGIHQAATAAGAEMNYGDERRFRETKINGLVLKTWPLYEDILSADKVINVPIAKHHSLSKLTMSMKNWMGVMGGSRSHIHQRIDEYLVDLSIAIRPTLTVLDAVRILVRNGPQGGNPADVKKLDTVVAGTDQVAINSYGATLFGMKGSDLGYIKMADQRGLGTMDLSKIRIRKITANPMKRLRLVSQGLFLMLFIFLFLQTESKGLDELGYPVRLFPDFYPLILITTLFAANTAAVAFYLSLVMITITVIFGRVFCGWACPLGTLHNIVGYFKKGRSRIAPADWHRFKYYLLIILVVSSLFTLQLVGVMDPFSLLIRSFSLSVYPLLNYGIRAFFDSIYDLNVKSISVVSESIYLLLKKSLLSFDQPFYWQNIFIDLIFFGILALNIYERRFWCKHLCPLGALLGVLSRYAFLKRSVSDGCTSCGLCTRECQGNALPDDATAWRQAECIACRNCDDICPQNALKFGFSNAGASTTLDTWVDGES